MQVAMTENILAGTVAQDAELLGKQMLFNKLKNLLSCVASQGSRSFEP